VSFLERFGPFSEMMDHVTQNFFDKNGNVHRWYHHQLDRDHAKRRMKTTDTFLVRDSSHKNSYVLMYAKSGAGLKEMLIEARKGTFYLNPDQGPEHAEKVETLLKTLQARTESLEPSFSTLFQGYTYEHKEDEKASVYEHYTPPTTVPAFKKYSVWTSEKAAMKEKSAQKISGYVPYYGGVAKTDGVAPGVSSVGSAAPAGGSKYASYDPSATPSAGPTSAGDVSKASLVAQAMGRAGADPHTGAEAPAATGSKYQTYDPTATTTTTPSSAASTGHSNYQAYIGGQ